MTDFPKILISDYDYELPTELIADYPLADRDESKLIRAERETGLISHHKFKDISCLIPSGSLLVLNTTRVISARFLMNKAGGGKAEILLISPLDDRILPDELLDSSSPVRWQCLVGGSRLTEGKIVTRDHDGISLRAEIIRRNGMYADVEFNWNHDDHTIPFKDVINLFGVTPLPPYIKREAIAADYERYQTVYADSAGSVAAPTAGLHFTDELIKKIELNGSDIGRLTLHVGPGTFLPVSSETADKHVMHNEQIFVPISFLHLLRNHLSKKDLITNSCKIIATGTTSLRTLESLYWHGTKLILNKVCHPLKIEISQYDAFRINRDELPAPIEAIDAIITAIESCGIDHISGNTSLFIVPGYEIRIADALISNFHLPKSTLLLLIASFIGDKFWLDVYNEAIKSNYRMLSYGDSSLLIR